MMHAVSKASLIRWSRSGSYHVIVNGVLVYTVA